MKLTDLTIKAFPFGQGQHDYPDDTVRGLSLRVGARTKTFMVIVGKPPRRRRTKLGTYPDLSLSMAREKARDALAQERVRPAETSTIRFEVALDTYYRVRAAERRAITSRDCERTLNKHFRPVLAKRYVDAVRAADIASIIDGLIDTPGTRQVAFSFIRAFFNWCYRRGFVDQSPIGRLEPPPISTPRDRVLSPSELYRIWHACPDTEYGDVVRLCMLSAQRIGQWMYFRREYMKSDMIVWPAAAMKGNRVHTLPLTPMVRDILAARDNRLVPFRFCRDSRKKDLLDADACVSSWTHHDLRRTWATISAEELGTDPHIIEAVLAHVSGSQVSRTYNRAQYVPQMRKAMIAFEEWLQTLLSNTESTANANNAGLHRERA